jgi:hypothetical protein
LTFFFFVSAIFVYLKQNVGGGLYPWGT